VIKAFFWRALKAEVLDTPARAGLIAAISLFAGAAIGIAVGNILSDLVFFSLAGRTRKV